MTLQVFQRRKTGLVWRDDIDLTKRAGTWLRGEMHFESSPGSREFDSPYDFSGRAVNNNLLNGRLFDVGSSHIAIQMAPAAQNQAPQGTIHYAFNQGQFWIGFRIDRIGYLHAPTRTLQPVGGLADYSGNLTRTTSVHSLRGGLETMNLGGMAEWRGLGSTPNGGEIYLRWRYHGAQLKEELVIDQLAREWITANQPPATPAAETFFGYRSQIFWQPVGRTGVPRVTVNDILQDLQGNHDFDDQANQVRIETGGGGFLGFLPITSAFVPNRGGSARLRKRFWRDGGDTFLFVGANVVDLNNLLPGDLVFDPSIVDKEVGQNTDDCHEGSVIGEQHGYFGTLYFADFTAGYPDFDICMRWTGVNIPDLATIDTCSVEFYKQGGSGSAFNGDFHCEPANNPATFNTGLRSAKSLFTTTANVTKSFDPSLANNTYYEFTGLQSPLQEVVDDQAGTGDALVFIVLEQTTPTNFWQMNSWDTSDSNFTRLNAAWTEAGAFNPAILRKSQIIQRIKRS